MDTLGTPMAVDGHTHVALFPTFHLSEVPGNLSDKAFSVLSRGASTRPVLAKYEDM